MSFLSDVVRVIDREWPENDLSSFTETVIVATICGQVLEHKQRPPARAGDTADTIYKFCRRHRSLSALLAQRIKMLRIHASLEHLDPILTFTALAAYIAVLMLYDMIESKPLGTEAQAAQLTKALQTEHQQQSLDAVADISRLVAALGQHFQVKHFPIGSDHQASIIPGIPQPTQFQCQRRPAKYRFVVQMHPLTPILLLLCARFAQSHPGLNNAYNKLMPCIITTLQAATNLNGLACNFLQLLGPQNDNWLVPTHD